MLTVDQTVPDSQRDKGLDAYFEGKPAPLTEAERASGWDDYETRSVRLWDELRTGR